MRTNNAQAQSLKSWNCHLQDRHVGFLFQHYALTVRQNIASAIEIRKIAKNRIHNQVEQLIELVQLT